MAATTTSVRNVPATREGLLRAFREYDAIGHDAFCTRHGHSTSRASVKFWIRHNGKSYPAKAIVGAATAKRGTEHQSHRVRYGRMLARLGFILGVLAFAHTAQKIVDTARALYDWGADHAELQSVYYASGSSRPGYVWGFAAIGQAAMVTTNEWQSARKVGKLLSESCEDALHAAGREFPESRVALDSGAFGRCVENFPRKDGSVPHPELDIGIHCPHPFTSSEWQEHFDLGNRLADTYASRLLFIAPDVVGSQDATLALLGEWRHEVVALLDLGVRVMVVMQKGAASQAEFDVAVQALLGRNDYVRGIPCAKGATTVEEIEAFAAARQPRWMHLLGLGLWAGKDKARLAAEAVARVNPGSQLSYDSCLITNSVAKVGRTSHPRETTEGGCILHWAKTQARKLWGFRESVRGEPEHTIAYYRAAIALAWGDADIDTIEAQLGLSRAVA